MKSKSLSIAFLFLYSAAMCPMDVPVKSNVDKLTQAIDRGDTVTVNMMLSRANAPSFVNDQDGSGRTALAEAAFKCDRGVMASLFAKKANPNARTRQNNTPLMVVAASVGPKREQAILRGIRTDLQAIIFADQAVCIPAVEILLENGADANLKNAAGQTPLFIALGIGNKRIADTIIGFIPSADLDTVLVGCASINRLDIEERPEMPLEIRRDALCDKFKEDAVQAQMARIGYLNLNQAQKNELATYDYTEDAIKQKIRDAIDVKMRTHKMPKIKKVVEIKK